MYETCVLVQIISINALARSTTVEYFPYMIRGAGDRAVYQGLTEKPGLLCSSDNRGGMKRRNKEIMKQPSGDLSTGENPGISL